jgi:hypothetical protein
MRHLIDAYLNKIIDEKLKHSLAEIERVVAATDVASEEQLNALAGVRSSIDALVESVHVHNEALDGTTRALRDLLVRVRAVEALMKPEKEEPRK